MGDGVGGVVGDGVGDGVGGGVGDVVGDGVGEAVWAGQSLYLLSNLCPTIIINQHRILKPI